MKKQNKGEWSELYVIGRAILDGHIPLADEKLDPLDEPPLIIESIEIRNTGDQPVILFTTASNNPNQNFSQKKLQGLLDGLGQDLLAKQSASFSSKFGAELLELLGLGTAKVRTKSDVWLATQSTLNGKTTTQGFSIKSQVGARATLLNASSHTNFTFALDPQAGNLATLESAEPIKKRLAEYFLSGGRASYLRLTSSRFKENLELLDSRLEQDLGAMLLKYYSGKAKSLLDLVQLVSLDQQDANYRAKLTFRLRKLLEASALGMTPGSPWQGNNSVFGGILILTQSLKVVAIPLQNSEVLGKYFLNHGSLETPSTSRHGFGFVNRNPGLWDEPTIDLNLQIRINNS